MAEKEYVERGVLIDKVEEIDWYHINPQGNLARGACSDRDMPLYKADDIYKALESAPSADVVEVVRCKNCAYANERGTTCHYGVGHYTSPMRYCSEGERKDGADNE